MRKEYDFSKAKPAKDVPHLARLHAEAKGKTRITIMLDNFVIAAFREMADTEGIGYQTLINRTLRQALTDEYWSLVRPEYPEWGVTILGDAPLPSTAGRVV